MLQQNSLFNSKQFLIAREELSEKDSLMVDKVMLKHGSTKGKNLIKKRQVIRLNPEYTDNLMKVDEFIFDGFIKKELIDKERRILRQFYKKRLVTWIQDYTIKIQEIQIAEQETITCRICDKTFDVHIINEHTENCQKMAELRKQIIELDVTLKQISEEAYKIQQKYNTQKNLQRNKKRVNGQFKMRQQQQDTSDDGKSSDLSKRSSGLNINSTMKQKNQKFQRCNSLNFEQLFNFKQKVQSEDDINNSMESPSLANINNYQSQNSLQDVGFNSFQQGKSHASIQELTREKNSSNLSKKTSYLPDKIESNKQNNQYMSSGESQNNINSCNNLESKMDSMNQPEIRNRNNSSIPYFNTNQISNRTPKTTHEQIINENNLDQSDDADNMINQVIMMRSQQNKKEILAANEEYQSEESQNQGEFQNYLQQVTEESIQNSKFYSSQGIQLTNLLNNNGSNPTSYDKVDSNNLINDLQAKFNFTKSTSIQPNQILQTQLSNGQIGGQTFSSQSFQNGSGKNLSSNSSNKNSNKLLNNSDGSNSNSPNQNQKYKISQYNNQNSPKEHNINTNTIGINNTSNQHNSNHYDEDNDGLSRIDEAQKEDSKQTTVIDIDISKYDSKQNSFMINNSYIKNFYSAQNSINTILQDTILGENILNHTVNNNTISDSTSGDLEDQINKRIIFNDLENPGNKSPTNSQNNSSALKKRKDSINNSPKSLNNEMVDSSNVNGQNESELQKRRISSQQQENIKISNELHPISEDPFEKSPNYRPKRSSDLNRMIEKSNKKNKTVLQKSISDSQGKTKEAYKDSLYLGEQNDTIEQEIQLQLKNKYLSYDTALSEVNQQIQNKQDNFQEKQKQKPEKKYQIQRKISDLIEGLHEINSEKNLDALPHHLAITPVNQQPFSNKSGSGQSKSDFFGIGNAATSNINFFSPHSDLKTVEEEPQYIPSHVPQPILIQNQSVSSASEDQLFGLQLKIQESQQDIQTGSQNDFFKNKLASKSPLNTSLLGRMNPSGGSPPNRTFKSVDMSISPKDVPHAFIFNSNKLNFTQKQINTTSSINSNTFPINILNQNTVSSQNLSNGEKNANNSHNIGNSSTSNISVSGGQDLLASPFIFHNLKHDIIEDSDILMNSKELAQVNEKKYLNQQQVLLNLYKQQQQFDYTNMKEQIQNFDPSAAKQANFLDKLFEEDVFNMKLAESQESNMSSDVIYPKHDNMRGDIFLDELKKQKLEEKLNMLYSKQVQEEDNEEGSCIFPSKYMVQNTPSKNLSSNTQFFLNNLPQMSTNSLGRQRQQSSDTPKQNSQNHSKVITETNTPKQSNKTLNKGSPQSPKNNYFISNIPYLNQNLIDSDSSLSSHLSSSTSHMQASNSMSSSALQSEKISPTNAQKINNLNQQQFSCLTPSQMQSKHQKGKKKKNKNNVFTENLMLDQLSSTSKESYDVLQRISEEENNVLKSLEGLIPIHNRLQFLEEEIKTVQSSLLVSRRNSIDKSNQDRSRSNSNQLCGSSQFNLYHVPKLNDIILSQTEDDIAIRQKRSSFQSAKCDMKNSPISSTNSPLQYPNSQTTTPMQKTSKFGMLKRAQTMLPNELDNISSIDTKLQKDDEESQYTQHGSRNNVFGFIGVSSKLLKSINSAMTHITQYGEKISKRPDILEINNDLKTQTSLKYSLPEIISETEAVSIVKKMINQLNERIQLQRKVFKLKDSDQKLLIQNVKEAKKRRSSLLNEIKFQFKGGNTPQANDNSPSENNFSMYELRKNSSNGNEQDKKLENKSIQRVQQKQYEYNSFNIASSSPQNTKGSSLSSNQQTKKVNFVNNKDSDVSTQIASENTFESTANNYESNTAKDSAYKKTKFSQNLFENQNDKKGSFATDGSQDTFSPDTTYSQSNKKPKQSSFGQVKDKRTENKNRKNDSEHSHEDENDDEERIHKIEDKKNSRKTSPHKNLQINIKLNKNNSQIPPDSALSIHSDGPSSCKHSYKNPKNISNFLKSPSRYPVMPLLKDIHSQKPYINRAQLKQILKQKNEKKSKRDLDESRDSSSDYLSDESDMQKNTNLCNSEQVSSHDLDSKKKKQKSQKVKHSGSNRFSLHEENSALKCLSNSTQITGLSYEKSPAVGLQLTKHSRFKQDNQIDDILEEALNKYNQRKLERDLERELDLDSQTTSSDEDDVAPVKCYSDSDIKYFNVDDVTFTQQSIMNLGLKDFEFKRVLGVGAFGAVWLVNKKTTKDEYALKIIDCSQQMDRNQQDNLRAETNVFAILTGDHVVKAVYSFQYDNYLCFVLDYMNGGDFGQILRCNGRLDESIAKFYLAEIILAIEYLHSKKIIHRDLKPENVLLDKNGHTKLADFGLSEVGLANKLNKKVDDEPELKKQKMYEALKQDFGIDGFGSPSFKIQILQNPQSDLTNSVDLRNLNMRQAGLKKNRVIGTPDYIPPEVINGESTSNPSIDWWSLGVMVYEFVVGIPPFNDESVEKIFANIKRGHIEWPDVGYGEDEMTPEAQDLIKKLLNPDYKKRLGANGANEIKQHKFFFGIQWDKIKKQSPPLLSSLEQEDQEAEPESENQVKKKELEKLKLEKILKRNVSGRRQTTVIQGMQNLWRVDLLAGINREEAEKRKMEKQQKENRALEKVKRLQRLATTLEESQCLLNDNQIDKSIVN